MVALGGALVVAVMFDVSLNSTDLVSSEGMMYAAGNLKTVSRFCKAKE